MRPAADSGVRPRPAGCRGGADVRASLCAAARRRSPRTRCAPYPAR